MCCGSKIQDDIIVTIPEPNAIVGKQEYIIIYWNTINNP